MQGVLLAFFYGGVVLPGSRILYWGLDGNGYGNDKGVDFDQSTASLVSREREVRTGGCLDCTLVETV